MAEALSTVIGALGDVLGLFGTAPLSYIVGIVIIGAGFAMIGGLFSRN